jgi:hypothetical protein
MLHVIHAVGLPMISQGLDLLLCGIHPEVLFTHNSFQLYVPMHLSTVNRSTKVLTCGQSWVSQDHPEPLSSANWFLKCHGIESYTCNSEMAWIGQRRYPHCGSWTPPPGVSPVAWTWSAPMGLGQTAHIMSSIGVHPLGFLSLPCTS